MSKGLQKWLGAVYRIWKASSIIASVCDVQFQPVAKRLKMRKSKLIKQTNGWNRGCATTAMNRAVGCMFFFLLMLGRANAVTQILNGEAFLQGQSAEVGVRANATFGSSSVPAGFHENVPGCLGFVVSRNGNGWGPGSQIDGDFFCPGAPVEAWALSVNGTLGINTDSQNDIPGNLGSLVVGGPTHSVTWNSTAPFAGIAVRQVYSLANVGQSLTVSVTLTNVTGAPVNNIQFGRFVDPDNATAPDGDVFNSSNTVVGQGANGLVKAEWTNGALVALVSTDSRTTVGFGPWLYDPANVINAANGWTNAVGDNAFGDLMIGLAINVGTLAPGASTTLKLSYPLTLAAAPPAAGGTGANGFTPVPTLSQYGVVILSILIGLTFWGKCRQS